MNPLSLFSQMLAVALALAIGYFYVQPTIQEIGAIQTDIAIYKVELVKIESVNNQLTEEMAALESISRTDKERLATYMPRFIDDISIMRDISFIVDRAGVMNTGLSYDGVDQSTKTVFSQGDDSRSALGDQSATPHSFTVDVEGSYDEIKAFLRLLEQNEYPLEVHELSMSVGDTGSLTASMQLITYVDQLVLVSSN